MPVLFAFTGMIESNACSAAMAIIAVGSAITSANRVILLGADDEFIGDAITNEIFSTAVVRAQITHQLFAALLTGNSPTAVGAGWVSRANAGVIKCDMGRHAKAFVAVGFSVAAADRIPVLGAEDRVVIGAEPRHVGTANAMFTEVTEEPGFALNTRKATTCLPERCFARLCDCGALLSRWTAIIVDTRAWIRGAVVV